MSYSRLPVISCVLGPRRVAAGTSGSTGGRVRGTANELCGGRLVGFNCRGGGHTTGQRLDKSCELTNWEFLVKLLIVF